MDVTTMVERVLRALLPARCLACDRPLAEISPALGLCPPCRGRLRVLRGPACERCGEPLAGADLPPGYLCGGCRTRPPAFDRLLAAWLYEPPLDAVVQALKFGRWEYLGDHLADALHDRFAPCLEGASVVTHVPLHWRRRLVRGYDQAATMAQRLASRLGWPHRSLLVRRRPTAPQTGLERGARLANVRGAFRARPGADLGGRRVALVDDVATTGATLSAAAAALLEAGAGGVTAVVAGRAAAAATAGPEGSASEVGRRRDGALSH